jgi:8-oxo-dGTP pyrophosphatase MutT (NUDIX family)
MSLSVDQFLANVRSTIHTAPRTSTSTSTSTSNGTSKRRDGTRVVGVRPRGHAAVLVPLFLHHDTTLRVVLTQRSLSLRSHPGETCFPGGKLDEGEDVEQAAFREAFEEIGLDVRGLVEAGRAEVLGFLDPLLSKHMLSVTPVVVYLRDVRALSDLDVRINVDEVNAVYSAPVDVFLETRSAYTFYDVDVDLRESSCGEERAVRCRMHSWLLASDDALGGAGVDDGGMEEFRIWGLTGWVLIQVAMIGYQREASFALCGAGGLTLGDVAPLA